MNKKEILKDIEKEIEKEKLKLQETEELINTHPDEDVLLVIRKEILNKLFELEELKYKLTN